MRTATRASGFLASVAVAFSAGCGGARSPQPGTTPAATAVESPRTPEGGASVPPVEPGAFSAPSPSPSASAATSAAAAAPGAAPPAEAAASASPSADPEAAKRAELEKSLRAQVEAARTKAEALSAQYKAECPELKPGELRHPGAVAQCNRLHDEAAAAIQAYETARKDAQAAGVNVP